VIQERLDEKRLYEMGKNYGIADSMFELTLTIIGFGFICALGVLGYQIFLYLRIGKWYSFSLITGLRWLNVQWAFYPSEWIGVYKILDDFPLSLGIFTCSLVPFLLLCSIVFFYQQLTNDH
jgi:hypothetical protein